MNNDKNVPYIIFLTGASGSGKTTLVNAFSQKINDISTMCLHFDSIGVPSEKEMIKKYGSQCEWQRIMINVWVKKLVNEYSDKKLIIFEGQVDLSFISSACENINFTKYKTILVHCDTSVRHQRLYVNRNQPKLINETMDNWSKFLKQQAVAMDTPILDTTSMTKEKALEWILSNIDFE